MKYEKGDVSIVALHFSRTQLIAHFSKLKAHFSQLKAQMNRISAILLCCVAVIAAAPAIAAAQANPINSPADDYAASFRVTPQGGELWFTTGQDAPNGRSRIIKSAGCSRDGFGAPERIADAAINMASQEGGQGERIILNGASAFARCDGNYGIIASNREVNGRSHGNDLYEIRYAGNDWQAQRIDSLCSDFWDDTPALSPDGMVLYFASDRLAPGMQRPDLFYSVRRGGVWSAPAYVHELNTAAAEESPCIGEDGYLYYATNVGGDYNIWRVRLDPATWRPAGTPVRLNLPGVNEAGSDETHPLISPGGNWFLFSSNRGKNGRKDFDIHWVKMPEADQEVALDVRLRTRDATTGVAADITVRDLAGGGTRTERSGTAGAVLLRFPRHYGVDPGADAGLRAVILSARSPSPAFVSSVDTLLFSTLCSGTLQHTLFLWDTATYRTPDCRQEFPIYQVRFFVTGYWCPTTERFRGYAPCASLFTDAGCVQPPCGDHKLYDYVIEQRPKYPDCIRYDEFEQRGAEFAREVDSAFILLREAMRSAFGIPCLSGAIRSGKKVKVEVIGTTDPRAYKADCRYSGETIDFTKSFVQIEEAKKPFFTGGTPMKSLDPTGNQLLSDLRAYNAAVMLDSIWTESIPEYRSLKRTGQIAVLAFGESISTEATTYERQRSIRVRVTLPEEEGGATAGLVPDPGRRVVLCSACVGGSEMPGEGGR